MIEGRDFASASTVGARERQEDDWGTHVNPPARELCARLLAVVADGMGGMPGGAQASDLAVRVFLDSYLAISRPARERLRHALAHANRELGIAVESGDGPQGMGCTLVAALFFRDRCEWVSIGDSSLFLCRGGALERVNPLHIFANELDRQVERGEISVEEANSHPDRTSLTSALQGSVLDEVAQGELSLESGDIVMLASDGVSTLSAGEITSICVECAPAGAGEIAETLISRTESKQRDGQDNATVVVVRHRFDDSDEPNGETPTEVIGSAGAKTRDTAPAGQAVAAAEDGTAAQRDPPAGATHHAAHTVGETAAVDRTVGTSLWRSAAAFVLGVLSTLAGFFVFFVLNE